jgi:phage/plasmid-associated DNA primase
VEANARIKGGDGLISDNALSKIGREAVHCAKNHVKHIPLEYPKQMGCSCELGIKCESVGKHPLTLNRKTYGSKSAITDPLESIKIWEQRPFANLGILTGPENDLWVLDCDIHPEQGIDGVAEREKLEREHGKLPDTRKVLTGEYEGRRAEQIEFLYPKGKENAKWKKSIAPGLEIRAHSNYYVVAPPSMHCSGVRYEYENPDVPRCEVPQWLIDLAEQKQNGISFVSDTALKGKRHHNIVAIAGMNRHKDIPFDTALNQCLDYNENHCSPPKPEYVVRNAVSDVYNRYEPGCVPKSVREEFPLTTSELTRGDRLLLKVAKRSKEKDANGNDKHIFKFLYDRTGLSELCPREYEPRDVLNLLIEKLAYWCNGDTMRMTRLLRNSKRKREFPAEDTEGNAHLISLQADAVVDGFQDADVIEYLMEGSRGLVVSTDLVAKEILANYRFLTPEDTKKIHVFETYSNQEEGEELFLGVYREHGDTFIDTQVRELLKHRYTTTNVKEIAAIIKSETYCDRDKFDSAPLNLIPLRNGVYDIDADKLIDYDPDVPFFFVYPGGYYPALLDAETDVRTCIETILPEYIGDGDELADANTPVASANKTVSDATVFQEIGGSCFYRMVLYKTALMLFGSKDSGKSVLLAILRNAVGKKARSRKTLQDLTGNRFAEAALYHKTLNSAADIGSLGINDVGKFNELIGVLDTQNCEKKGVDGFEFESYATHVYSTNDLPALSPKVQKAEAEAFYSRWVLIETTRRFVLNPDPEIPNEAKEDGLLKEKIETQRNIDYATTWFIEGLKRALKNGAYSEGDSAFNVKERWIHHTDSLAAFAETCCEHTPGFHTPAAAFKKEYSAYCVREGMVEASDVMIGRRLPHLIPGTAKYESHGKWWRNLSIKGAIPIKDNEADNGLKTLDEPIEDCETRLRDFGGD